MNGYCFHTSLKYANNVNLHRNFYVNYGFDGYWNWNGSSDLHEKNDEKNGNDARQLILHHHSSRFYRHSLQEVVSLY